jgi:hypothetical protein
MDLLEPIAECDRDVQFATQIVREPALEGPESPTLVGYSTERKAANLVVPGQSLIFDSGVRETLVRCFSPRFAPPALREPSPHL